MNNMASHLAGEAAFYSVGGSSVIFLPTQAALACIVVKQVLMTKQMLS